MKKIDTVGLIKYNKFGSKMTIIKYRNANDIDILFEEYNWITKHSSYNNFKNGLIKCPYDKSIYGLGYIGEGKYKSRKDGKMTKCYSEWIGMMQRCYDSVSLEKNSTYKDCEVEEYFFNFQNFGKWFEKNYYECNEEQMHLDKDILVKGNKVYSPDTCIFVPQTINKLFVKCDKARGSLPIGIYYDKERDKYTAGCHFNGKRKFLGRFDTPEEAFAIYKQFKENTIKQIADEYKDLIPEKLYNAMYKYEVEIND